MRFLGAVRTSLSVPAIQTVLKRVGQLLAPLFPLEPRSNACPDVSIFTERRPGPGTVPSDRANQERQGRRNCRIKCVPEESI